MAEKLLYTMGEVAEMFDVKTSLIRYWEGRFSILRPTRNKKGNRLFSARDVENLKLIYHLVRERGMTLEGARQALKRTAGADNGISREVELRERLERIRTLLLEVREDLKTGAGELLVGEQDAGRVPASASVSAPTPAPAPKRGKAVEKIVPETPADPETPAAALAAQPAVKSLRKPRRGKESEENKELFAFYEQSLF